VWAPAAEFDLMPIKPLGQLGAYNPRRWAVGLLSRTALGLLQALQLWIRGRCAGDITTPFQSRAVMLTAVPEPSAPGKA